MMNLSTFRSRRIEAVKERPMSFPSRVASDQIFRTQQPNKLLVTVQIENIPGGRSIQRKTEVPKNTTDLERCRCYIPVVKSCDQVN